MWYIRFIGDNFICTVWIIKNYYMIYLHEEGLVGNRKLENGAKSHKEMNFRLGGKIELSLVRFRRPYKYNCQSLKAYLVRDQRYDLSSSFCTFLSCKLFIYIYIYIFQFQQVGSPNCCRLWFRTTFISSQLEWMGP
jgi:hypothetical protein